MDYPELSGATISERDKAFAGGFDMMAAEEVLSLKLSIPMLKLVAVVPFKGQSAS